MIDKKHFEALRKEVQSYDEKREELIKACRDILKLSKKIIYAVHRDEIKNAEKELQHTQKILKTLRDIIKKTPKLEFEGSYSSAVQEYVEAALYLAYMSKKPLPTAKELGVQAENYILGISDLSGELARKAIHLSTQDKPKEVLPIRDFVEQLYQELLTFDIRRGDMRKKFDQIKYDLRRLDDMAFQLKVNGKI